MAAPLYANLSGLFAGVAFTGIVFILAAHSDPSGLEVRRTLTCLFVVVFGLFLTAFEYATMAAEQCGNRAMSQSLVAGAGFCASTILAWLGLAWLLRAHTNEHDVHFASAATFAAIVLLAVFLMQVLVEDAWETVGGKQLWDDSRHWLPVASMAALAVLGGVTLHPKVRAALSGDRAAWLFEVLITVGILHVALQAALFSFLANNEDLSQISLLPGWLVWLTTVPVGLIAALSGLCFPFDTLSDTSSVPRATREE